MARFGATREEVEELSKLSARFHTIMRWSRAHDGESPQPIKWTKKIPFNCPACNKTVSNKTKHINSKIHLENERKMLRTADQ